MEAVAGTANGVWSSVMEAGPGPRTDKTADELARVSRGATHGATQGVSVNLGTNDGERTDRARSGQKAQAPYPLSPPRVEVSVLTRGFPAGGVHPVLLALRCALKWRAIVKCRRSAVLGEMWELLHLRSNVDMESEVDGSLSLKAAAVFLGAFEEGELTFCEDLVTMFPWYLMEMGQRAELLGFQWRTTLLSKLIWDKIRIPCDGTHESAVQRATGILEATVKVAHMLPADFLVLAAEAVRPVYVMVNGADIWERVFPAIQ